MLEVLWAKTVFSFFLYLLRSLEPKKSTVEHNFFIAIFSNLFCWWGNRKEPKENTEHGDVVVANVPEGYYNYPTLKSLIALKFVSCYCPNAAYYVKSDDDNYLNIPYLFSTIRDNQRRLSQQQEVTQVVSEDASKPPLTPLHLGVPATNSTLRSMDFKWGVLIEEYMYESYPDFLSGYLNVLSMSAVKLMALSCPYICIGMDPAKTNVAALVEIA